MRNDGGTEDQSRCVFQSETSLILCRGSSRVVRNHQEKEQIRYRLLVLMKPRIDQ